MDQNIDFSGSDQIQTLQYPVIHPSSQEISDKVFQAKGDLMKSIQTFLEEFNYIPYGEKPKILLQAWDKKFSIKDWPIFFDDNEDHSVQYKEYLENSSNEIIASNSNQEKEKPPQDSDIQLVEICRQKELYCMHDNVDNLIESALNSKLLSINLNSQHLDKKKQEVKNVVEHLAKRGTLVPILSTKEPEYSLSMGYEHPNTTPEMKSDEIMKSGVEELVPIPNECEVTLEDKKEGDVLVCENYPICDDHSDIYSDSNNDDDISSDNDAFEDIEYIKPDQERLINVVKNDMSDDSTNDPLLEEVDLFLAFDNSIPPGIENFGDDSEGYIRFLEELLIDDSILFPNNESSESDFDNPLFPRPPPKPPDVKFDFEPNSGEVILVVINDNDELECLNPRDEIDVSTNNEDEDYFSFMFVIRIFLPYLIYPKVFPFLLPAESEDTIFNLGFTAHRLKFFVFVVLSRSARASHSFFKISLGKSISLISIV
nr:hypothetical protein [Tanacetum cinerariifolium]